MLEPIESQLPFHLTGPWTQSGFAPEIRQALPHAYKFCTDIFGEPRDSDAQLFLMFAPIPSCQYLWLLNTYVIALDRDKKNWEPLCANLGHEMFHRVTMRRPGLHQVLWVRELLAVLIQDRFLRHQGLSDYADYLEIWYQSRRTAHPLDEYKAMRKWKKGKQESYPTGFTSCLFEVADKLMNIVDWTDISNLTYCRDWSDWFDMLPPERDSRSRN